MLIQVQLSFEVRQAWLFRHGDRLILSLLTLEEEKRKKAKLKQNAALLYIVSIMVWSYFFFVKFCFFCLVCKEDTSAAKWRAIS